MKSKTVAGACVFGAFFSCGEHEKILDSIIKHFEIDVNGVKNGCRRIVFLELFSPVLDKKRF